MQKISMGAAAAALMVFGSTGAMASVEICGALPNGAASWNVSTIDGYTEVDVDTGDPMFAGRSGNAFATVTTTTTVFPDITRCTPVNNGGNLMQGLGFDLPAPDPEVTVASESLKVCQNVGGGGTVSLVAGVECTK